MNKKFFCITFMLINIFCKSAFAWTYAGRAEATQSVQIHPELTARITKKHFRDGSIINKGAILFTLNTAKFQAEVSIRKAELEQAQAEFDAAEKYFSRLRKTDKRGVPASEIDTAQNEVRKAAANVEQKKAALKMAQIDLNNTKITAPFSGRIGKSEHSTGSYVTPENVLAEIVQINPIRIVFAMPDKDYLSLRNTGKNLKYELTLADETLFNGTIEKDFEDNTMNPETGTINIWLKADNQDNILLPGALVRVTVTSEE